MGFGKKGSGSGCKLVAVSERRRTQNWQLRIQGVVGKIHARGRMPITQQAFSSANVIWNKPRSRWELSICAELPPRRFPGLKPRVVKFNLIDGFATVDGEPQVLSDLHRAMAIEEHIDKLKAARDQRWSKRAPQDPEWQDASNEIARLYAKAAQVRHNALHVWTTNIVRDSRMLVVHAPRLEQHIASPRGNEKEWGANVKAVSQINRRALSYAAGKAVRMLVYKASEAGIRCDVITDETPDIAIGEKLVAAGKKLRKLKRALTENSNEHHW
jgi:hypothetical protein